MRRQKRVNPRKLVHKHRHSSLSLQSSFNVPSVMTRRYGPGEYYIGVRSADIPSRFMLRVLSTSAEEEISAHMRVAETIVNSLSIMANMDPHVRRAKPLKKMEPVAHKFQPIVRQECFF